MEVIHTPSDNTSIPITFVDMHMHITSVHLFAKPFLELFADVFSTRARVLRAHFSIKKIGNNLPSLVASRWGRLIASG